MVERDRRHLVLWSRTAFWFVALCVTLVVVQFGEEGESVGKTFELEEESDDIFNSTLEKELEGSGTLSPDVLREAVLAIQTRLKGLESKSNKQWNTTTNRFSLKAAADFLSLDKNKY
jgi:hypothetical protein